PRPTGLRNHRRRRRIPRNCRAGSLRMLDDPVCRARAVAARSTWYKAGRPEPALETRVRPRRTANCIYQATRITGQRPPDYRENIAIPRGEIRSPRRASLVAGNRWRAGNRVHEWVRVEL